MMPKDPGSESAVETSKTALLAVDAQTAVPLPTRAGQAFSGVLGYLGGGMVLASAVVRLCSSDTDAEEKADAVPDAAWGLQACMQAAAGASGFRFGNLLASQIGFVGGALQSAVGVERAWQGVKEKNLEKTLLNSASSGAGICWAACSLGFSPLVTGVLYLGLTLTEKGYVHRKELKKLANTGTRSLKKLSIFKGWNLTD